MLLKKHILGLVAVGMSLSTVPVFAADAISAPAQKVIGAAAQTVVPSLAVLNSTTATLSGGKLTLGGVAPNTIVFSDRPVRAAGHVLTSSFIKQWDEGKDSFAKDPPNATISVLSADGKTVEDAVVVLASPTLSAGNLVFDVSVLEGGLNDASGPASLFVDWYSPHQGYGPQPAWQGGWYGHRHHGGFGAGLALGALSGGVLGAAFGHVGSYPNQPVYASPVYAPPVYAAPAYPTPVCGYYPYPACY